MTMMKRILPLLMVVALAAVVQLAFVQSESDPTPYKAAINFARAYFRLDPSMANDLYPAGKQGLRTASVAAFLQRTRDQITERGFGMGMAKSMLFDVKTKTDQISPTKALVHLTAYRRTAINPVFCLIGKFFDLGKSYPVDATLTMCKEHGKWKVRLPAFNLAMAGGKTADPL